jgi:BirA family biotin operon repressor/biotin-[acetyl-CoA-carboxylase] ligase
MNRTSRNVEGGYLLEFDQVESTQDVARELLQSTDEWFLGVRAGWQSAGRGRSGSSWVAAPGDCLLATYVLRGIPAEVSGRTAFAAGVAVAEALAELVRTKVELKWPNDVLASGRKIAGILIETADRDIALVGIGINVMSAAMPAEIEQPATSLRIEQSRTLDTLIVEDAVRSRLFAEAKRAHIDWPDLLRRWKERDCTAGRRFRAENGLEGIACGVADDGALLLRLEDGSIRACYAASAANG